MTKRSLGSLLAALLAAACSSSGHARTRDPESIRTTISPSDWPTYGHDAQHTFHGRTLLTKQSVTTLKQAWSFPTGDAVTATPTVVASTVYVGSWDGNFYALDLRTGTLRWKFVLDPQPAVEPQPGVKPRTGTSDGGMVTSSAWFEPANGRHPDLVLFGGGFTLYALAARTGQVVWKHAYTGRPDRSPDPDNDGTRIFSSPVVVDGNVIVGVSPDGAPDKRGYVTATDVNTGRTAWTFETNRDAQGAIANDGCGGVWSSGTLLPRLGLVVFDVSDCHGRNQPPLAETVIALRVRDGTLAWSFKPTRIDPRCDFDFGASVNADVSPDGTATFLGVGGKDGTYYALDPATGHERWHTNVVFGGFAGGFIGTTAYDGGRVYGSTAIGDFGRGRLCAPDDPRDQDVQEPTVHAFDARTGAIAWQGRERASFAPTTVAAGMTFNGVALKAFVEVRDADTGELLHAVDLPALCWSGIATVGDAIVFGTGAPQQGAPDGVLAFTPGGHAPTVPER